MPMKSTIFKAAAPLAIAAMLLAGCSGGGGSNATATSTASGPAGTLRVNWGGFPQSWAPGAPMESGYLRVPYETLVVLGDDGVTIEPWLATEWTQTATDLTLKLRDDVVFHDGTPFNAEAVKANIEYVRDNPGQYSGALKVVTSVDVVDDYTVKLNFSRPAGTFLTMLTQKNVPIASPASIADGSIVTTPVGTGPWAYSAADSVEGTKMTFQLFDDYWGDEPGFENIELYGIADDTAATAALLSGEIDVTDTEEDQLPTIDSAPNAETLTYPAIRNNILFLDRGPGGIFEDVNVRKALCYAANNEGYPDVDSGVIEAPQQHFLEGEFGYNPDIEGYPFDEDQAADLLAEAGNPTIEATAPAAPFNKQQWEFFADGMNQLDGVNITVQELPVPQFISEWNTGKYPLAIGNNPQITPQDWYTSYFAESAGANPAHVESAELKAAAQAALSADDADADAAWQEVMKVIIDDEALACAFTVGGEIVAWNTDTVTGAAEPSEPWEQNLINYRDLKPVG